MSIAPILERARAARRAMLRLSRADRDQALEAVAEAIERARPDILEANRLDLQSAVALSSALRDRLRVDSAGVDAMVRAVREVRALPDPIGASREVATGRTGIRVTRRRIPIGVIAIVYEARPNVTAECAALTLRSANVVVLRGGKEARHSNTAIGSAIRSALVQTPVPADAVLVLADSSREDVRELLGATGTVDLVIPRGGAGLMTMVDEYARVPVIRHGRGVCQVYVDERSSVEMAVEIVFNAKVQRPGVCNAMETLLVHAARVDEVMSRLGPRLASASVEIRADARAREALGRAGVPAREASDVDWDTEFLDRILAVRTVGGAAEAIEHIARHGTHHTAAIVTEDAGAAERFLAEVDASCVLWNASTRLNDGGELGLGAEMGISTSRMHAYGPMSVNELTAEKLVVYGTGQIRG